MLGSTLDAKTRERVATHLHSVAGETPALVLPSLGVPEAAGPAARFRFHKTSPHELPTTDLAALGRRIAACLAEALDEQRAAAAVPDADGIVAPPASRESEPRTRIAEPGSAAMPTLEVRPVKEPEAPVQESHDDAGEEIDGDEVVIDIDATWNDTAPVDPEVHSAELADVRVRAEAADAHREELARLQAEATERHADELARLATEAEAEERHRAELARLKTDAEERRLAAVAEARDTAARAAQTKLASELKRVRAEEADAHVRELERLQADAAVQRERERARLADEAAQQRLAAVEEARKAAEAKARQALTFELSRVRNEAASAFEGELARVRAEAADGLARQLADADRRRAAEVDAAAETLETEIGRVRASSNAQLQAELERVHQEAEAARVRNEAETHLKDEIARLRGEAQDARRRQDQARREEDEARVAAARQARAEAEATAARVLEEEVARVRAEAQDHLTAELERVREEAEQARRAQERALADAEVVRENADREARAAASQAAATTLEQEVAPARAEAEAHFHAELERLRGDGNPSSGADDAPSDALEAQARAHANAALHEQIARIQAEADARFAHELAQARTEAERRRHADVEEIRSQVAQAHATASQQARAAAAGMVRTEIGRAATRIADALAPARLAAGARAVSSVAGKAALRLSRVAAVFLLAVGVAIAGPTLLEETAHAVRSTSDLTASWFLVSVWARTSRAADAEAPVGVAPQVEPTPADVGGSGMLSVASAIPLDLYLSGRPVGTSGNRRLVLPAGRHALELHSERYDYRGQLTVTVEPGRLASLTVALPDGQVHITTADGAEIWIDDTYQGVAPLGALAVPIGTRGVRVRHPELGERRLGVEVRYGEVTEATVPLPAGVMRGDAFPLPPLTRNAASSR